MFMNPNGSQVSEFHVFKACTYFHVALTSQNLLYVESDTQLSKPYIDVSKSYMRLSHIYSQYFQYFTRYKITFGSSRVSLHIQ